MPKMTKRYISWMLSILMCFSNSFTVGQAEEPVQTEEPEHLDVMEEEHIQNEQSETVEEISIEEKDKSSDISVEEILDEENEETLSEEVTVPAENIAEETKETTEPEREQTEEETALPAEETAEPDDELNVAPEAELEELTEDSSSDDALEEIEIIAEEENETNSEAFAVFEDFTYTVKNNQVTITKYNGSDAVVTIPSEIEGNPVTIIDSSAFINKTSITSITMPDSITTIGGNAFNGCTNLTDISLSNDLLTITAYAFKNCSSLTSITIPRRTTSIGMEAFENCSSLSNLKILGSTTTVGDDAFRGCTSLVTAGPIGSNSNYEFGWTDTIPTSAFYHCENLNSITIPEGIIEIGGSAFSGCKSLEKITLPDSITSIGSSFSGCSNLVSVNLSKNLQSISPYAFSGCSSLSNIEIPAKVKSIGSFAFSGCSSLLNITIPNGPTNIGEKMFYNCTSLNCVSIPESVVSIGYMAFAECSNLNSITIPGSINSISSKAFENCLDLKTAGPAQSTANIKFVNVNSITEKYQASGLFTYLEEIDIPDSVTSIGKSAFSGCASLVSVTIPESVTSIGESAFHNCSGLTSVTVPNQVKTLGSSVFSGCTSLINVSISESVTSIGSSAFSGCKNLSSITLPRGIKTIPDRLLSGCSSLKSIVIPEGVTSIGGSAFHSCINLNSVTIPGSVTNMSSSVFEGCSSLKTAGPVGSGSNFEFGWKTEIPGYTFNNLKDLTSVVIPSGITSLGTNVFTGCSGLKHLIMPESVISIGDYAFSSCTGLTTAGPIGSGSDYEFGWTSAIPAYAFKRCSGLTSISIPDGITNIGESAFENCYGLTSVVLPSGLTSLEKSLFSGCTSLTKVVVPDSVAKVSVSVFNNCEGIRTAGPIGSGSNYEFGWTSVIPESAFQSCAELTKVTIPDGVEKIGKYVFAGTKLSKLRMPESVTTIEGSMFNSFKEANSYLVTTGPIGSGSDYEYGWTTQIPDNAFNDCSKIASITLPDTITRIGVCAFADTAIQSIRIPSGVTNIESGTFSGCKSLKNVILPSGLKTIGASAFDNCISLTSFTIPYGVTSIGTYCFISCRMTEVTIPGTVTSIGYSAFSLAGNIKDVYFGGTQEQWTQLCKASIGLTSSATVHFNSCLYGHQYGEPSYTWTKTEDGYDVTAEVVCRNDSSHVVTETVHAVHNVVQTVSCEDIGIDDYIAEFSDPLFTVQTKRHETPAYGHDYQIPIYTWIETEQGYDVAAYTVCKRDSTHEVTETASAVYSIIKDPLCEEEGTGLFTASFENHDLFAVQTHETVIEPTGHDYQYNKMIWTGDDENGYTAVSAEYICTHDSEHKEYTLGNISAERTEPTCENNGSVIYTASVSADISIDGKDHSDTKIVVIPATGHDYEVIEYTWEETEDGYKVGAYAICRNDNQHELREQAEAVYTITKEPLCEENGKGLYTASFANEVFSTQTKEIELEALGHDYQFSSFLWTGNDEEGYSAASAEYICTHDESHKQTAEGTVEVQKTEPTCEEDGSVVYTAAITAENSIDGKEHTDTKTVIIPALGHIYKEPVYTWTETENGYSVSASSECERDPSHRFEETVEAEYSVKEPARCEETGIGVYTASFTDPAFSTQTKEITLEALGHDYQFSEFKWTGNDRTGYTAASAEYVCTHDSAHKQTKEAEITSVRTEPTCEAAGSIVYTVAISEEDSIDGKAYTDTKTVVLAATGHNYGTPQYEWEDTAGGYRVKASAVCQNDESHVLSETVNAVYQVTKAPTCEMTGTGVYTATFNNSHFRSQTKTIEIPAVGHHYGEPEYSWNKTEDGFTVTAKTVCQNDSSHVVTETVTAGFEMIDDPSQEYKKGLYTAEFKNELFETQTKIWTFVSGIQLDQTEVTVLSLDERITLHAVVLPEAADNKAYHWESSDEAVATVDENGIVTVHNSGEAIISAVTEEGVYKAECVIKAGILSTGIALDITEKTLNKGETLTLTEHVTPAETSNQSVTWTSSDPEVASVDENGVATALKTGEAVITAKTNDTGLTAECRIQVITPVKGVKITAETNEVIKGETLQLKAVTEPEDADNQNVIWSSDDESVATIDETGLVTAIACGTAVITAETQEGGYKDTYEIQVINPLQGIQLNQTDVSLYINESETLTATLYPEDATDTDFVWTSSNESAVTVDQNGTIKAISRGEAIITVSSADGTISASAEVLAMIKATSIENDKNIYDLNTGEAVTLHPYNKPENSESFVYSYTSSNESVAKVNSDGVVQAVGTGTAVITISGKTLSKTVTVNVSKYIYGTSKVIDKNNQKLIDYILENGSLSGTKYSTDSVIFSKSGVYAVYDTSDPDWIMLHAGIFENGGLYCDKYSALLYVKYNVKTGEAKISLSDVSKLTTSSRRYEYGCFSALDISSIYDFTTADFKNLTITLSSSDSTLIAFGYEKPNAIEILNYAYKYWDMYLKQIVGLTGGINDVGFSSLHCDNSSRYYPKASRVYLSSKKYEILPGDTVDLEVLVSPAGAVTGPVTWTNNHPDHIEIYGTGSNKIAVKGLQPGAGTITARNDDIYELCTIKILNPLKLKETKKSLVIDQTQFPIKIDVTLNRYSESDLVWSSSDKSVAVVDQNGKYTVKKEGTAVITVKTSDNRFSEAYTINAVQTVPVTGISIDTEALTIEKTESIQLNPTVYPENASNKSVIWTSSDEEVAVVDENGKVTALKNGTAEITGTTKVGGYPVKVQVTVITSVSEIVLSAEKLDVLLGETGKLQATVLPEDATNKNFTWSSSDPSVVSVDADGTVHALTGGTAVITAVTEDQGKTAECLVTSVVKAENIRITEKPAEIEFGRTNTIQIVFEPENTTNQKLIWTSSDESIATVDENGVITAVGEGPVTITAVSDDGGFKVSAEIIVHYTHIETLSLSKDKLEVLAGSQAKIGTVILPENASNKKLYYESENAGIASVDENGIVTGVSQGKTTITVTSDDGRKTVSCTVTVHPRKVYVKEIPVQRYTGKAIKPELMVYDSGVLLEKGKDYTLSYKNNTKAADKNAAKAPTVIIKMVKKGNYAGSQQVTFTIEPVSLEEDNPEITVDAMSVQSSSKQQSPVPNVYWNGKKLKNKTDYTVTYPGWNRMSAGNYSVQIEGKGNYSGTRMIPITVTSAGKTPVSKLKISAAAKPFRELTGDFKKDILSCLTVKSGKTDLYLDRDYEYVEGSAVGCETIGSCKFNIRGLKGYEGERTVTVKITGTSLTDKKVTEVNTAVYKYNGEAQKLSDKFKLKYNGTDIDPSNYEILEDTYQNNINAGTASVVIEGRNEYYGRRTVKFVIQPVTSGFSREDVTVGKAYYTKGGSKPEVTVKGLTKDDYTVTYQNNKAVGFGTVIITGKGNYKGLSISKSFRIERKDISETTLTVKDKVFSSKAGGYKSAPVLKDTDGKTLKAGTDYLKDIKYERLDNNGNVLFILGPKDIVGSGELIRVTVTGTGNYTGSITAEYRILYKGMDISKAKVSAATKEYTGNEITLGEDDLVVKIGTAVLTYGIDYEIIEDSYTKNINKGTATVMIKGINDYGGVKTVKFKISQRNISSYWEGVKDFLSRLF